MSRWEKVPPRPWSIVQNRHPTRIVDAKGEIVLDVLRQDIAETIVSCVNALATPGIELGADLRTDQTRRALSKAECEIALAAAMLTLIDANGGPITIEVADVQVLGASRRLAVAIADDDQSFTIGAIPVQ